MQPLSIQLRRRIRPGARGFTLIEIMIVIGIMAVVMAISIPSMYRSFEKDSIRSTTQDVLDVFSLARAEAIMSGRPVKLVIRPRDNIFIVMPMNDQEMSEEELLDRQMEKVLLNSENTEETKRNGLLRLSDQMRLLFVGVNFVPDLQETEMVPVRFYPNGTCDQFAMAIASDRNETRVFTLDVATAVLNWKVGP